MSAPNDGTHSNWVIFLSTDMESSAEHLLEIYALHWSIEVYFKEVKQNFGFMAEQSGKYQVAYFRKGRSQRKLVIKTVT